MDKVRFGVFVVLLLFISFACASLTINQIKGPDSVELGSVDELILDCDFDAEGENDTVVKWFFNDPKNQIYQWIVMKDKAFSFGSLKALIDPTYNISNDPKSMFRALKFKEVTSELTGNYTCKVDSNEEVEMVTKQVIVYSPPSSFEMFLIGGDDEYEGDEVVLCDATDISPKPDFDLEVSSPGMNSSQDLPEMFRKEKRVIVGEDGTYNVSFTLAFNGSYLNYGTTKFTCLLSIPGTNFTMAKSMEYDKASDSNQLRPLVFVVLVQLMLLIWAT